MAQLNTVLTRPAPSVLATNRVLRNTYLLLAMTLLFSATTAGLSMFFNLPHPGWLITLVGYFGLLFCVHRFANSALGLVFVFALTGFMGYTLGPIINAYVAYRGAETVMLALGGTGVTFLGLSAYALTTRKDFSFLGGMLFAGVWVAFLAGLAAIFIPGLGGLQLAVSAMFVVLMCGMILFETGNIVHGGETNYIRATVTLFVSLYNLFTSLLHLLGVFGGSDD